LRNCFSSCALEKYTLLNDGAVVVVRPGPIGLHVALAATTDLGDQADGSGFARPSAPAAASLLVTEAETRAMRCLEQRRILRLQTVHDTEVRASAVVVFGRSAVSHDWEVVRQLVSCITCVCDCSSSP
jgi:hypothetical protein